ncbi:MAG: hypothetical protein IJO29_00795 [Oscillospiraceae bacterium]|nr:hypothetical protein [Oscillospiraceae bacterium]
MEKVIEYIVGVTMLIILFIVALISSDYDSAITVMFFLLIMLLTLRSINDTFSLSEMLLHLVSAAAMAALSGNSFCFILLCQVRREKYSSLRIFMPAVWLCMISLIKGSVFYTTLMYAMIITGISALICAAEKCFVKHFDTKDKLKRSISICALGELSEKKLNDELRIKNYLSDRNARLEERENISRSIHNSVGHSITAAIMTLDAADMLFDTSPDKARKKVCTANERMRDSLASIRRAVRVLDSEDKPIPISDICDSVEAICKSFAMDTKTNIRINFSKCSLERLIPSVHAEFFCSATSEVLSNGVKHGKADMFILSLASDSKHLQLTVTDNGESDFCSENSRLKIKNGFGLKKIISYCEKNGGKAEFSNSAGFKSVVTLPIIEEES